MPLVLQPSLDALDKNAILSHLEEKRSRRMLAAIEYHQGKNAKLANETDKLRRRRMMFYERLRKELLKFDKASAKIDEIMDVIDNLNNEIGLTQDMMTLLDTEEEDDS